MYVLIFIRYPKHRTNFTHCSQARDKGRLSLSLAALQHGAADVSRLTPDLNWCESDHIHRGFAGDSP